MNGSREAAERLFLRLQESPTDPIGVIHAELIRDWSPHDCEAVEAEVERLTAQRDALLAKGRAW